MNDLVLKLHELGRDYLPYEFLMTVGGVAGLFGTFFMIASVLYSILRIRFAIKREGLSPPSLHAFNIYVHWEFFLFNSFNRAPRKASLYYAISRLIGLVRRLNSSSKAGNKKNGSTDVHGLPWPPPQDLGDMANVPRHIKPIDRFLAWGYVILMLIFFIFGLPAMWLYPEYFD